MLQKKFWPTKIVKKAVKKLQKWRFLSKNVSFSIKKACKINTYAPKRLKYGLKWSQENTLDDQRGPQTIFFQNEGVKASKFWLPGKNDAPVAGGPV